jgi:flagellar basal-body rod protein FlgB
MAELDFRIPPSLVKTLHRGRESVIERLLSSDMMSLVQRSLDAAALSHSVISNNLANVDTPGFKRSEVVFGERLKKALAQRGQEPQHLAAAKTDTAHLDFDAADDLDSIQPEIATDSQTTLRNDGNNVDIDKEMSLLAQNTVWYSTLAQLSQMQFSSLRSAITEGKR